MLGLTQHTLEYTVQDYLKIKLNTYLYDLRCCLFYNVTPLLCTFLHFATVHIRYLTEMLQKWIGTLTYTNNDARLHKRISENRKE